MDASPSTGGGGLSDDVDEERPSATAAEPLVEEGDDDDDDPTVALVKKKREVHKKEKRKRKTEKERARKEKAKRRREWAKREGKISAAHRASWLVRAAILACISLLSVGSYFAYDSIAALETYIKQDLDLNSFRFGFLYSSYAIPNIVLLVLSGYVIDRLGNRNSALVFLSLTVLGTFIVAIAPTLRTGSSDSSYTATFLFMLLGRFVFGLGAESSYVAQSSMCVEWFGESRFLATAMAITISVSRFGPILAFNAESRIAEQTGHYVYALWFAFLMCVFSLGAILVYAGVDWASKRDRPSPRRANAAAELPLPVSPPDPESSTPASSAPSPEPILVPTKPHNIQSTLIDILRSIVALPAIYWLGIVVVTLIYTAIYSFRSVSTEQISIKYGLSQEDAGFYLSVIDIVCLVCSPFFGYLVDCTGKKGWMGNSLAVVGFLLLGFTELPLLVGVLILGVHLSLMPAAIWPCIAVLVDPSQEGMAFAHSSSAINLSLLGATPLAGYLNDQCGFECSCMFFAAVAGMSVVLAVAWVVVDAHRPMPVLNGPMSLPRSLGASASALLCCRGGAARRGRGKPRVVSAGDDLGLIFDSPHSHTTPEHETAQERRNKF